MKTLRQHYAAARAVMKDHGYRSSFPSGGRPPREKRKKRKGESEAPEPLYLTTPRDGKEPKRLPGSPTRPWMRHMHQRNSFGDQGERLLVYALSVLRVVERYDRTGWAKEFLGASGARAGRDLVPDVRVCPLCFARVAANDTLRKSPCVPCGTMVKPASMISLVRDDVEVMERKLSRGLIPCERE